MTSKTGRLASAVRSALYLIRRDRTHIGMIIQAECRAALRGADELATVRMPWPVALGMCLEEIEQFHRTAYPTCDGDCPAHRAMAAARTALTFEQPS